MGVLDGKVAIVTGGGQGVGRGIALALATEGASVAVLGRTASTLDDACEHIGRRGAKGLPVVCDVRDAGAIERAVATVVAELGTVDILVNNAQIVPHGELLGIAESVVEDGWRSGPLAALRLMRACHPYLCGGGVIVNISSGAAHLAGPPGYAVYGAVKSALATFTRAAAVEWGHDGIRANVVLPLAESDAVAQWRSTRPEAYAEAMGNVPVGRMGDPELDVGRAVVFLAGPDSGMITGTTLAVDGGGQYLR